jgi:hypothetical protein
MEVNSGSDPRIQTSASVHAINPEECDVYSSLLDTCASGMITPCINHTMTDDGDIEGFRFTCAPDESAHCLPVNRKMFFRTSMVECQMQDTRTGSDYNRTVLEMLLDHDNILSKLGDVVKKIYQNSVGNEVSFECMPDNLDQIQNCSSTIYEKQSEPLLGSFMCRRATDCKDWSPELPEFCGLFHAYTRGFNQDSRQHKLFIITSGGCNMLCDHYFNMCLDINDVYAPLPHSHVNP